MSDTPGFRRAMYMVTGTSLLVPLIGVVTAPILAQALGVAGRGEVAAAVAPNALVVSVATLGLPEALTMQLARQPGLTRRALRFATVVSLLIGVGCFVATVLSASLLTGDDPDLTRLLLLGTALAIPTLVVNLLRGAASGRQLWGAVAIERAINSVLRLIVLGGLAVLGHLTVTAAVLVVSGAPLVAGLAYWKLIFERPRTGSAAGRVGAPLLSFGSRIWIGSVAMMLNGRLAQLLVTPLSDVQQLGLFIVAITISDVPLIVAGAVREVIFGVNARATDTDRLTATSRITVILGFAGALVLGGTLPWWIRPVFGDGFEAAVVPTQLLLLAGLLGIPGFIAGSGLGAWGRPGLRSTVVIAGLAVNVVGLTVLIPLLGALGAALAGIASSMVASVVGVVAMSRVAAARPLSFVIPRKADLVTILGEAKLLLSRARAAVHNP